MIVRPSTMRAPVWRGQRSRRSVVFIGEPQELGRAVARWSESEEA
jgi:hypothetical protein